MDSHNDIPIEDELYHEAFCYLPIIIAGYYIDRIGEWINNEDSNKYSSRCVDLCNRAIVNARKLADWDNVMSMEMLGRAYHQLGFCMPTATILIYGMLQENIMIRHMRFVNG